MPFPDDYEVDDQIELEEYLRGKDMQNYRFEYQCDICGKNGSLKNSPQIRGSLPEGWVELNASFMGKRGSIQSQTNIHKDICPECAEKLLKWARYKAED